MDRARITVNAGYAESLRLTGRGVGIAILDTGLTPLEDFLLPKNRITVFKDFINDIFFECLSYNFTKRLIRIC